MGENTKIEWCDHTFNPWWGCTKVSEGCRNCYAEAMAKRTGNDCFGEGKPRLVMGEKYWQQPLKWNDEAALLKAGGPTPRPRVFCGSMCDVFDEEAPIEVRMRLWKLMEDTPNLDWMVLTKRIRILWIYAPRTWVDGYDKNKKTWPKNVALGVTVEESGVSGRARELAHYKQKYGIPMAFVSVEPMLEPVGIDLRGIDLVICGCESLGAHPFNEDWARELRDRCIDANVNFFYKQGRINGQLVKMPPLDGIVWDQLPEVK